MNFKVPEQSCGSATPVPQVSHLQCPICNLQMEHCIDSWHLTSVDSLCQVQQGTRGPFTAPCDLLPSTPSAVFAIAPKFAADPM